MLRPKCRPTDAHKQSNDGKRQEHKLFDRLYGAVCYRLHQPGRSSVECERMPHVFPAIHTRETGDTHMRNMRHLGVCFKWPMSYVCLIRDDFLQWSLSSSWVAPQVRHRLHPVAKEKRSVL